MRPKRRFRELGRADCGRGAETGSNRVKDAGFGGMVSLGLVD